MSSEAQTRPEAAAGPVEPITEHGHRSSAPAAPARPVPTKDAEKAKEKDARSDAELTQDIRRRRDELSRTLDALEYKLDVPARGQEMLDRGTMRGRAMLEDGRRQVLRMWDENPLAVAGAAAGAVLVVVGGIVGSILFANRDD